MNQLFSEIPGASKWSHVEEIHRGWSSDKKYYIQITDGRDLLLRMADKVHYDKKKREFEAVKKLNHVENLFMSRPLEFGLCHEGQSVYSLLTWIEGKDAEEIIPMLAAAQQYRLGVQAGEALKKMHEIHAEQDRVPWAEHYNAKINRYITNYKSCGIFLKGADQAISFIEQNRHLLENRPQTFQHGDYHVGYMIILAVKYLKKPYVFRVSSANLTFVVTLLVTRFFFNFY